MILRAAREGQDDAPVGQGGNAGRLRTGEACGHRDVGRRRRAMVDAVGRSRRRRRQDRRHHPRGYRFAHLILVLW